MPITELKVSLSPNFLPSVLALQPNEGQRVLKAVTKFSKDTTIPSLNVHPIHSDASGRLFSFRASDELRVLAVRLGEGTWVLEEAGHHDALYARAESGVFLAGHKGSVLGFFTAVQHQPTHRTSQTSIRSHQVERQKGIFDHWTDSEMVEFGMNAHDVKLLRGLVAVEDLLDLEIGESKILIAIEMIESTPEKLRLSAAEEGLKPDQAQSLTREPLVDAVVTHGSSWGFSDFLTPEQLEKLLAAPIERWMIFLHPAQEAVVKRQYAGPARIGGAAGTGKSVVALHRAAELAHRYPSSNSEPQVLFTTFIKSLPEYFSHLYERLPQSVPGAVRFVHVDALAAEICRLHGLRRRVDMDRCDELFVEAFTSVSENGDTLNKSTVPRNYVREEIDSVIRGRMTKNLDDYLMLERTGRKTPLQASARRQIWRIHEKFRKLKAKQNDVDFLDVLEEAVELTKKTPPMYRCAIIDEAQDLSLLALRLVRNLVNGGRGKEQPDGLMLVGDGAQRVYPSCYTLAQAGIKVRGRSTTLQLNYRNTKQILQAAMAVTGDREVDDLESTKSTKSRVGSALPPGEKPLLVWAPSMESRTEYVAKRIEELVRENNYAYGDIGVLAPTNRLVGGFSFGLAQLGLPVVKMAEVARPTNNQVRVGTFHRAKGLEFKAVFLIGLEAYPTRPKRNELPANFEDRRELELNVTFVAMTRARELLEVVTHGDASEPIQAASKYFKKVKLKSH